MTYQEVIKNKPKVWDLSPDFSAWSNEGLFVLFVIVLIALVLVIGGIILFVKYKEGNLLYIASLTIIVILFSFFISNYSYKEEKWENDFVKEYMKQQGEYVVYVENFKVNRTVKNKPGFANLFEEAVYVDTKFNLNGKSIKLRKKLEDVKFDEQTETPYVMYLQTNRDIGKKFKKDEPYFLEIVLPSDYKLKDFQ